jgi:hypothetical protein
MPNRKDSRKSRVRKHGGGVVTSQQFFDPEMLPPSTIFPAPSSAPTYAEIRPIMSSTFQTGGKTRRSARSYRGGFSPSIMGGFAANAQAAIVPLALYMVYHTMVPKVDEIKQNVFGGRKNKQTRKNRK